MISILIYSICSHILEVEIGICGEHVLACDLFVIIKFLSGCANGVSLVMKFRIKQIGVILNGTWYSVLLLLKLLMAEGLWVAICDFGRFKYYLSSVRSFLSL